MIIIITIIIYNTVMLQIQDASSQSELQKLLNTNEFEFRFDLGINKPSNKIRLEDRETIVSSISLHQIMPQG